MTCSTVWRNNCGSAGEKDQRRAAGGRSPARVAGADSFGEHRFAPVAVVAAQVAGALLGCAVAVTGRVQGLGQNGGWTVVVVQPFKIEDGYKQLVEEWPEGPAREKPDDLRALVKTVGGLPLAIHLVAGHLQAGRSIQHLVEELREKGWDLSLIDPADPKFAEKARNTI